MPLEPVKAPRLWAGYELVGPLKLALLKPGQFNALRSRYLNPHIARGAANLVVAVRDGTRKILGVFAMAPSGYTPDEAYLQSDFAVAPTDCRCSARRSWPATSSRGWPRTAGTRTKSGPACGWPR